jgi:AcrR family transcriptional regulator
MFMARLAREDWVDAAYARFSDGGIGAVSVEAVARDLGATKGSFYWHFTDRGALVDDVLTRWEELETERLIDLVERVEDPAERLAKLLEVIAHRTTERSGERTLFAEAASLGITDVVARATERRASYTARLLEAAGIERADARRRAVIVVAAVVGYQQLVAGGWDPGGEAEPRALIETLFAVVTADQAAVRVLPEAT